MENITHCAIFLTERCNLACEYCYQSELTNKRDLDEKTGKDIIDFLFSHSGNYLSIAFFGGEPLLRFDLMQNLMEYAKDKRREGLRLSFSANTNGTLINREILDYLRKNRVGIVLSLDGTPQAHDLRRRDRSGKGCFHILEEKIPMLLEDPRQVHIRMTVTPETVEYMFEGVRYIHSLGFQSLALAMDRIHDGWDDEKREIFKNEYVEILNWYKFKYREGNSFALVDLDYGALSLSRPYREKGMPCNAGIEGIAVDPCGVLFPCYRFVGIKGTDIGDIFRGFDEEKRDLYRNYYRNNIEKCRDCSLNFRCHRCPWLSFVRTGDIYEPVEINCFEAELMINLFRDFRDEMEAEQNSEFMKRQRHLSGKL